MFLCFKLAPIVCSALFHSTLLSSWLLEQVWNIKTHRENPQNSEPQNGPRSGLDYIALGLTHLNVWPSEIRKTREIALVHLFNNRWRWCCGHFNFGQRTLKLSYQRSLSSHEFCQILVSNFFITFCPSKPNINSVFTEL